MIDLDVFERQIRIAATAYGIQQNNPYQAQPLPPEDATAARVLYAIADALRMATDNTQADYK